MSKQQDHWFASWECQNETVVGYLDQSSMITVSDIYQCYLGCTFSGVIDDSGCFPFVLVVLCSPCLGISFRWLFSDLCPRLYSSEIG